MQFVNNNLLKIILRSFRDGVAVTGAWLLAITLFYPEDAERITRSTLVVFIVMFSIFSYIIKRKQRKSSQD